MSNERTQSSNEELARLQSKLAELEAELQRCAQAEQRLRSLMEHTTDAVFYYECNPPIPTSLPVDEQVRRLYDCVLAECNEVCARSYGANRPEEVIGRSLTDLFGTSSGSLDTLFSSVVKGGYRIVDGEATEELEDGTKRHFLNNGHGVVVDDHLVGMWGTFRDITDNKRAAQALLDSEQRYRSLVDSTMDGYFILEIPSGRFLFVNQPICDLFGYTAEEALTLTIWDVVDSEEHGRIRYRIAQRMVGKLDRQDRETYTARCKDDSPRLVEVANSLVSYEGNMVIQGLVRDVTKQARLQNRLLHAQKMEAIGTLAGGVAHDFNNQLMGIQGTVSLMLHELDPDHPHLEMLKNIELCAQNSANLTKQLLGFAREGKYELKTVNLRELIDYTLQMFARTRKEITVHAHSDESLWIVEVDRSQIERVLLNLYLNAWQAMPDGGDLHVEASNVTLSKEDPQTAELLPGPYVCVSVTDTGAGMDEPTLGRIFDPFFTTKDVGQGTGLGLASAYGIIKNHSGTIEASSTEGRGSTFRIYLPKTTDEKDATPPVEEETVDRGKGTILLVDDEEVIIATCGRMLAHLGYEVIIARSGDEAVALLDKHREQIDLVILDMVMPGTSGAVTFDKLREMQPELKVMLASGYSTNKAAELLSRGAVGFLQKPFRLETLSRKTKEALEAEEG